MTLLPSLDGGTADAIAYDNNGQMTSFSSNGAVSTLTYDASGNRDSVTSAGVTTDYTPNNLNQYSNVGGLPVTNEGNGNLGSYNGWYYSYDAMNRLTAVSGWGLWANF